MSIGIGFVVIKNAMFAAIVFSRCVAIKTTMIWRPLHPKPHAYMLTPTKLAEPRTLNPKTCYLRLRVPDLSDSLQINGGLRSQTNTK